MRAPLEGIAGVLVLGVAPAAADAAVLIVRAAVAGVLGDIVRVASEPAAAERTELDEGGARPDMDVDDLTGDRTARAGLTGEAVRADILAAVEGLDADAEEAALVTLLVLVRLMEDGGAEGAKLVLDAAALAGVAATLLRGLKRPAAVAEGLAVAALGRGARAEGVGGKTGSSSTLCISSSGERT